MLVQHGEKLADGPVELDHGIATVAEAGRAAKSWMRESGNVNIVGCVIEEKGFFFVRLHVLVHPAICAFYQFVGHVGVVPKGALASVHDTDAGDTSDDGAAVTVGVAVVGHRFWVFASGWVFGAARICLFSEGNGIVGI